MDKIADLFAGNGIAASSAVLRLDINGIASAKTTLAQADLVGISDSADGNAAKKVTFSNLEDQIFGNVSGDATIAAGGALTIANDAITTAKIAADAVTTAEIADLTIVNGNIAAGAGIAFSRSTGTSSKAARFADSATDDGTAVHQRHGEVIIDVRVALIIVSVTLGFRT